MNRFHEFAKQLIQTSARGIVFTDEQARVLSVNDAALIRFGSLNTAELIGCPLADAVSCAAAAQLIEEAAIAMIANAETREYLGTARLADGKLTLRCARVTSKENDLLGYAYVFAAEEVSAEREYDKIMINNLMRNSQDMIYFKDLNSAFTRGSGSLVERVGANCMGDVVGKSDFDFWDADCAASFFHDEQEIIRTRQPITGKAQREIRADGKATWVLSSKMPLIDGNDQVVGTFGISKDITLQKKFEIELEQTHKKLVAASRHAGMAEVATNVIHNVGNVLNSINVSVSQTDEITRRLKINNLHKVAAMIKENAGVPEFFTKDEKGKRVPEYLTLMADELLRDKQEIEEELQATKRHLEHIKMIVSMQQEYATASCVVERVEMSDVLEDAIRMSSGSLERHQIALVRDFQPGMIVTIDKHRVLQILVNLIRNAKHAMQDVDRHDKALMISIVREEEGKISIKVTDNGVGISPDNLVNLFNHGFTTKKQGHGFGLHSGANAAKELGGSLSAASDGLGLGATFTLTLPLARSEAEPTFAAPILHSDVVPPATVGGTSVG